MTGYTAYHSQYLAHRITLEGVDDDALAKSLSTARVDMNPHQVDAALFALQSPIPRGAILADEVGLGKTIEAGLVIAQRWAEGHRNILLIVPASLRKQWTQELFDKFGIPACILEAKSYRERLKQGHKRPFEVDRHVVVTSYEFSAIKADDLRLTGWDLVVFDEAHRMRNVYRKGASKRAKALRDALTGQFKLLLTATPLQNSLMELYGLVSIIDDKVFGDEASFRTTYGGRTDPASLLILRERLKTVCRRTLRKDVQEAGHINYTKRLPVTFKFEPHENEVKLYEALSGYLQRKDTIAFGDKPNQLITLVVRKILGSSTFAVAQTLESIVQRLKAMQRVVIDDLSDLDDADEIAEEWLGGEDLDDDEQGGIDPARLAVEISELETYLALARSITVNAKGQELIRALDPMLKRIVDLGGKRKAVIFTESVRTQKYLADLLSVHGYAGQIALMNGQNNDQESQAIYSAWKTRHEGTDAMSGSKTADMKAAIVEAFREQKTILIATESGAEGINLQFCSLLMNFDLPWNPQRVEQRIGRCHRYGQAIDVLVVNFLNLKNRAEERVFELLDLKFKLFGGVFGASDDVLGAIENGTDFERRVFEIYQKARSKEEIDAEFDQLQVELEDQIKADVIDARSKLMGFFDQDVVRILKDRKQVIERVLGDFEERLVTIARAELPDVTFSKHSDGSPIFVHEGDTWTTGWPLADNQRWKFFRLADGNLASTLADRAKSRALPLAKVTFDYKAYPNGVMVDVQRLLGGSGWLQVSKLAVKTASRTVEHLLVAMVSDDGRQIDDKTVDRLFLVPGAVGSDTELAPPTGAIEAAAADALQRRLNEADQANAEFLAKETDKLDAYAEDLEKAADAEIKTLEEEIRTKRKEIRTAAGLSVTSKVEMQRAVKKIEGQRDELMLSKFQRKKEIRKEVEDILDSVQASLSLRPERTPLFTIRWELRG